MRPTPIYDELTARHREGGATAGPPAAEAASILSFPAVSASPVAGPVDEKLPQRRPRHALRRG